MCASSLTDATQDVQLGRVYEAPGNPVTQAGRRFSEPILIVDWKTGACDAGSSFIPTLSS